MTPPNSRPARIALATRIFSPEPAAASARLTSWMSALADRRVFVSVFTTKPPTRFAQDIKDDKRIIVRRWPVLRDKTGYVRGALQYLSFDIPLFFRLLFAHRPDALVAEPPPTTGLIVWLVGTIRRIPVVYIACDVWTDALRSTSVAPPVVRAMSLIEHWVLSRASAVITVSDVVGERVRELGAKTVHIVPFGADLDVYKITGPHASDAPTVPYFIYAGTASELQGAEIFVDAFARLVESSPSVRLIFMGNGSAWDSIASKARAAGIADRVELLPFVPPAVLAEWLRGAVASLASVKPGQGYDYMFATKVWASLGCGTPVVYAGVGPAGAMIKDHDLGLVVDYSAEAIADAMRRMLATPGDEAESERLARYAAEHGSQVVTGRAAADAILSVVMNGGAATPPSP